MDENLKNLLNTDIGKIAEEGKAKSGKRRKSIVAILLAVCLVAGLTVAICGIVVPRIEMQNTYNEAAELLADRKFKEARAIYIELGDYKDSQDLLEESSYQWYKQRLEQGDCSFDVETGFEELGDYKDSAELESEVQYERAIQLMNKEQYMAAHQLFVRAGEYKDAPNKANEMKYLYAKKLIGLGRVGIAEMYLRGLGDYKDSAELLKECQR